MHNGSISRADRAGAFFVAAILFAACGGTGSQFNSGGPDGGADAGTDSTADVAPFVGIWNGSVVASSGGSNSAPQQASLIVVEIDSKTVEIAAFCSDGSGPRGTATGASTLVLSSATCPAVAVTGCSAVVVAVQQGTGTLASGNLSLVFETTSSGCNQSYAYVLTFVGTRGQPRKPTAVITGVPSGPVQIGSAVAFDGSSSSDPLGRPLTYQWSLAQRPPGSSAQFATSTSAHASFTPDVPGTYVANLVVSAGGQTSPAAQATLVAIGAPPPPGPPVVSLAAPRMAAQGQTVALDASASRSANGTPLSFSWSLTAQPDGSVARLTDATVAIAHLQPDLVGSYGVQVTVSDGARSTQAIATVEVRQGVTSTLSFRPSAARYSRALDRIVFVSDGPAELHLYDPMAQADATVALPLKPTCLSVSGDGLFAAVGHDAWVSYVDLSAAAVVKTWPVTASAGDVVLGDPVKMTDRTTRFVYVFPSRDQWVAIHTVDLGNGAEKLSNSIYAGMRAVLQPGTNHLFGLEYLSPAQIYRFDLDPATGSVGGTVGSPYWGSYPMGPPLWASSDGAQLLTGAGTRFRPQDLTYAGTVSLGTSTTSSYSLLAWADFAPDAAHWLVQPSNGYYGTANPAPDTSLVVVDSQYLASPNPVSYPPFVHGNAAYDLHGRWVFYDSTGTHKIAVTQVDPSAGALLDFAVLVL